MILRQHDKLNIVLLILAGVITVVSISFFIIVRVNEGKTIESPFNNSITYFESGWCNQYGLSLDVSSLASRELDFDVNNALILTKEVPEFDGEAAVFFRTNNP